MVRLPGHVLPALARATVVPSKPGSGNQPITLTIVSKARRSAGFRALAALRTCVVTIQFGPQQAGKFKGTLMFIDTANGSPQSIPLYGTASKERD